MDSKRTQHAADAIAYPFVWPPKDRKPILGGNVAARLEQRLRAKANGLGGEMIHITSQPDHLHLVCRFPPSFAPDQLRDRLKGNSAHALRQAWPRLNSRLANVWMRSSDVGTAGPVSAATLQTDLDAQPGRS